VDAGPIARHTEPIVSASKTPTGPQPVFTARRAVSYAISVDTLGKLRWSSGDLDGDHLVCVLSERAPADYLTILREKGISYVVAGESSVNLAETVDQLGEHFGIRTLLLEGGGHINAAFLQVDLVDEVSLLVVPGVDGRRDIPTIFGGVNPARDTAVPPRLKSLEQRANDTLWIRDTVVRS
jgi:2,5-diamino-6-(ribosylamino)-4(3H)-pyrimidinone 5'-phosphate reductase